MTKARDLADLISSGNIDATEFEYLDGVTSDIQTQLDAKAATSDIGTTIQAYDADTAKYDDTTANFTGTLQNGGSNVVVDSDIGSTIQSTVIHKGTNYTAVSGDNIVVTAGSITITLPASPSAGDYVQIKDGTGDAETTSFTVARNGSNIASDASDLTFDKNFAEITMTYVDATIGWTV